VTTNKFMTSKEGSIELTVERLCLA